MHGLYDICPSGHKLCQPTVTDATWSWSCSLVLQGIPCYATNCPEASCSHLQLCSLQSLHLHDAVLAWISVLHLVQQVSPFMINVS